MKTMQRNPYLKKFLCAAVASALFGAVTANAQDDFPDKPINVTVSYSAGGATDFQARIVTMLAADYVGEPMVIVNRPGAGGQVGWNSLIDQGGLEGYDLAAYNVPHFIAQSIMFDTKYNIDNLAPIANWGADPAVLIVSRDSEFDTVDELIAFARENPGKLTVSGAGLYVGHHIASLQLEEAADVDFQYIPSDGGVDAMKFVQGGQVMAGFNNLSDAYRNQDRLKILAVADVQRNEAFLPDVPTFEELGYDVDDSSVNFRGLMTRDGVPADRVEMLAEESVAMFNADKVKAKMREGGSPMRVMTREEVRDMWERREAYLTELLAELRDE